MDQAPPFRTGTLKRPGCSLHYEVTGSSPALVFAHGLGGNHLSWWQQVGHFAPRFTCVTFAHRGFAPSSPLPGGPDPADFAGDLAALVAELGIGADHAVVAQSMGGWTAVEYALTRPAGLRHLVLAATTGPVDPARLPPEHQPALRDWASRAEAARAQALAHGIHPAAGPRMAAEQPALHGLYRQVNASAGPLDREALRRRMAAMRCRAPEELRGIACPILLVAGAEDIVMPPMAAAAMAALVPGARAELIGHAGHSAYFERPDAFNAVLDRFLAR